MTAENHASSVPARYDRPSASVPSVDDQWDAPAKRAVQTEAAQRDLSQHRVYHSLYEDLLN